MASVPPLHCGTLVEKARFALDPVSYLLEHGRRNDVTRMRLPTYGVGTTEYLVVSDPELAVDVLTDGGRFEQYSDIGRSLPFPNPLSNGDDGIEQSDRRAALVDGFTGDSYRRAIAAAGEQIGRDVGALRTGRRHDAGRLTRRLTMRATARALFDRVPPAGIEERIATAADRGLRVTNLGLSSFLPVWTPRASLLRVWLSRGPVSDWIADAVRSAPGDTLVRAMGDSLGVGDDRLADVAPIPLVAGFVSPEVMLSTCLELLGAHPDERAAVSRATADLPRAPTNADLVGCREAVRWPLLESVRLYPPTYSITRRATAPTTLSGYEVARDDLVWIDQWSLGRDPDHWSDPDAFSPGRWAGLSPRRDAFLPFGAGPRACPAKGFSLLVGELVLAALFRGYDVDVRPSGLSPGDVSGGMSLEFERPGLLLSDRDRELPIGPAAA